MSDTPIPIIRRMAAALIDMVVVAVPTVLVALALSERFAVVDDTGARPRFSEADQLRINEIDQGFNRALRLGDNVFTLSGTGWWVTVLVLVVLTALFFVLLPATLRRRSPGQMALSMPIPARAGNSDDYTDLVTIVADPTAIEVQLATDRGQTKTPKSTPLPPTTASARTGTSFEPSGADKSVEVLDDSQGGPVLFPQDGPPADRSVPDRSDQPSEADKQRTANGSSPRPESKPERPESESTESKPERPESESTDQPVPGLTTLGEADDYLEWDHDQDMATAAATADRTNDRSYEELALAESSLAESPLNASTAKPVSSTKSSPAASSTATKEPGAAEIATAESPIWSDLWNAWLYWDPKTDRWFRHDTDANSWRPLK